MRSALRARLRPLIAKQHGRILPSLHLLADLIPPYWQTLEFALSVAHRGQIPS